MVIAIGDCLSDLVSSDDVEDADDEDDEDTELGKLREDDEPGWVVGTSSKRAQQHIERFRQKQMKLDELTQPGWGDVAEIFREWDEKYGTPKSMVPAVINLQIDQVAAAPATTTFRELAQSCEIVLGNSRIPQGTPRPGTSYMRLCSGEWHTNKRIMSHSPDTQHNSSVSNKM